MKSPGRGTGDQGSSDPGLSPPNAPRVSMGLGYKEGACGLIHIVLILQQLSSHFRIVRGKHRPPHRPGSKAAAILG
jgi:hypothetical protein